MKILWVFNHPAPYKVDFFNELGKHAQLRVLFERGREADREKAFYYSSPLNFEAVFLKSLPLGPHNSYSFGLLPYLKEPYDVIVINGWSTFGEMKAISYLRKKGIPYVFAINGGIIKKHGCLPLEKLKEHYIKGADLYLCPDQNSARYLTHYGAEENRIRFFPYSTVFQKDVRNASLTKEERKAFYEQRGIKARNVYVSVGQFIKRKDPLTLIEYFKDAPKEDALVLLGSGPLKGKMEKEIKKLGLHNVYLPGYKDREETLAYLAHAEASIFLTKEDIYGHVVNESLSQGTPVIASPFSNAALKLIKDGSTGYIIKNKDEFLMALQNSLNEDIRENCLVQNQEETIEKMVESHLAIFEEYLHEDHLSR